MKTILCITFVLLGLSMPAIAQDWQVVYQNDFSTNPNWTTNDATNNYWNAAGQNYHTNTYSSGNQYSYVPVSFVQGNSYKLEFDLSVANADSHGGKIIFGLGDSDMARYQASTFYASYWNAGDGSESYRGQVIGEAYMNDQGATYHPSFDPLGRFFTDTLYHNVLVYDYAAGTLTLNVTKSDGSLLGSQFKTGVGTFTGIDRLYISSVGTDSSYGLAGEGYLDNVVLSATPEPASLFLFGLGTILLRKYKF